jgi:hypothetical protein
MDELPGKLSVLDHEALLEERTAGDKKATPALSPMAFS